MDSPTSQSGAAASAASSALSIALPTRRSTTRLGRVLAQVLTAGDLLILTGPLGAGKTFLVRALSRGLGLPSAVPVTSPTFALVQDYETQPRLVHADLYRLGSEDEALELGLDSARRDGAVVVVEWGEPFIRELGGDALCLTLTVEPRTACFSATGRRSAALLEAIKEAAESSLFPAGNPDARTPNRGE